MARISYMGDGELVEPAKRLVEGHPINLYRALAHSPGGLEAFAELGEWIRYRSLIDPRLRELAILAVGASARCRYEFSHHVKIGRDFGLSDADVSGVLAEVEGRGGGLGEVETLVVAAAVECTTTGALGEQTVTALARHLDDERLVELVLILAHYAGVIRVLESLEIDVEEDYAGYLEEFPLGT